jgi:GntR family transcriptional repressor for pyruvate dehydrogenase complex
MAQTDRQGRSPGSGVTHEAIETIRELIASGTWGPGTRLPREADLAAQLGLSRNSLREAVRALSLARVLEVRQGDGTYVSSLEASELLEPTSLATNLLRGRTVLELFEVRRLLEPEAAALAALRADDETKAALRHELDRMYAAGDRADELVEADAAFHDVLGDAPGNAVLRSLLRTSTTPSSQAMQISPAPRRCCTSPPMRPGYAITSDRRTTCPSAMPEQVGLHTRLQPGAEERYDELHRAVWPDVLAAIRSVGITRWLIFRDGLDLFHFVECADYDEAIVELARDPVNVRWQAEVAPLMETAHDYTGKSADRLPVIFELER